MGICICTCICMWGCVSVIIYIIYSYIVLIVFLVQFATSYYYLQHLENGSWSDASQQCQQGLGTLWAINSYAEFWHVSQILGMGIYGNQMEELLNIESIQVLTSTLSFIGLLKINDVCFDFI